MSRRRYRRWCFTINNPNDDDLEKVEHVNCRYICVGDETGDEGTPHLQGYIEFVAALDAATVEVMLGGRARLTMANGTAQQNLAYCSKELLYHERGTPAAPGARTDISAIKAIVHGTGSMRAVIENATSYQALRTGELLLRYIGPERKEPPTIRWFWGPSGTGKTREAFAQAGEDVWISGRNLRWWDGYDGHRSVIIDDFRGDFCPFHELLRILDRYPYRVEIKGGSRILAATAIWITSDRPPEQAYPGIGERIDQLTRRIHETREFAVPA